MGFSSQKAVKRSINITVKLFKFLFTYYASRIGAGTAPRFSSGFSLLKFTADYALRLVETPIFTVMFMRFLKKNPVENLINIRFTTYLR